MFPITFKKRFIYNVQGDPRWAADKLREYLTQSLIRERARNVVVNEKQIRFSGRAWYQDLLRVHFLYGISEGKITVDYRDMRVGTVYQISFLYYVALFALMLCWWALVFFGFTKTPLPIALLGMAFFSIWFGLFFIANIAVSCYRFNRFMKDRLREFFNSTATWGVRGELITSR
jgi:hypothetical protein